MSREERFNYGRGDTYQAVEFSYLVGGMSMLVILPDEGQFEVFEASLNAETLNSVVRQMRFINFHVFLPKFGFDYSISLSDTLAAMGMPDTFNSDAADFSGMVEDGAGGNLFISDVLHKARIALDEYGTEAAAAMEIYQLCAEDDPVEVRIDRPFIFAIRDQMTGTLLFLGRVMNPST
jgi:serpin B